MKILYDLLSTQPNAGTKYHGGGEYSKTVFLALIERLDTSVTLHVFYNKKLPISKEIVDAIDLNKIKVFNCYNEIDVENVLKQTSYDVFYSAMPYIYKNIIINPNTKFIYTLHGLRWIELPYEDIMYSYSSTLARGYIKRILNQIIPRRKYKELSAQKENVTFLINSTKNQMLITDSNHSKYSLINNFPIINESIVKVFYAPRKSVAIKVDDAFSESVSDKYNIATCKYILMVSGNRWEKNDLRGAIAADELFDVFGDSVLKNVKVVITGVTDRNIYLRKIHNVKHFVFLEYVVEEELEILYKNAYLFLYPTLNEGFGYPPIEAMKYNVPSACSAVTSIPEICGDAVLYFNPYDISEIKNRILQSFNTDIYNGLRAKASIKYTQIKKKQQEDLNNIVSCILCK